ncbi:glycerol-3-phosphate acyltransferase 2, mitochondrial [Aplochiton taeniatus]
MVLIMKTLHEDSLPPPTQQRRPALSWGVKIKKKLKAIAPFLGKFRPSVGQCCHQCTPNSLAKRLEQNAPTLGFQNLLSVNETQTRYRGWLVRRVCVVLFVRGCRVYPSPADDRLDRVCQSNRLQAALSTPNTPPEGDDTRGRLTQLFPYLSVIHTCISPGLLRLVGWGLLKLFGSLFCSVQVNLNHLVALHRASQQGAPLVYVCMRHSIIDATLIPLVLFCHNLRVPYTLCPQQIHSPWLRSTLQKLGVVLLPLGATTEQEAEKDSLYSPVMTSLMGELLREGQAMSVAVSGQSGQGGQWLACLTQLIKEGALPDASLVPVGITYDSCPSTDTPVSVGSAVRFLLSLLWGRLRGGVRIHFAQPFSLKEMCETWRCRVDGGRPLQDLLLPAILNKKTDAIFGQRRMSWILPHHYMPELIQSERDLCNALTLHLIYSTTSCMAVMSTSLVSSLLLHRHHKGVCVSALCRDVAWLIEEVLFRNKDVGLGGSLVEVVYHSLTLLAPYITMASISKKDPLIAPRPSLSATLSLSRHAQIFTHIFITEAIGACAVSAMLCEVAGSGISSRVRSEGVDGDEVRGDLEFDVALGQEELTERALQLSHLLPPGCLPPCQSSHSFALDAVDSLVRCGILVMEEVPRDNPICDFWRKQGALAWSSTDNPDHSDSDCEEQDARSYKLSQPSQCPEMLFFLCGLLSGQLRALCWATEGLHPLHTPLPESCTEEMARTTVRTLTDLGVLREEQQGGRWFLGVSAQFQKEDNRKKLLNFVSQYLYN